jgi:hypothetical protein
MRDSLLLMRDPLLLMRDLLLLMRDLLLLMRATRRDPDSAAYTLYPIPDTV